VAVQQLYVTSGESRFSFQTELDGKVYGFDLHWNTRDEAWYLTILDSDDEVLLAGLKLVVSFPLISRFRSFDLPPGELEAVDTNTTTAEVDPGLDDLGQRVLLIYTPPEDLPEGYAVAV
jgi:hypothetical protein